MILDAAPGGTMMTVDAAQATRIIDALASRKSIFSEYSNESQGTLQVYHHQKWESYKKRN